MCLFKKTVDIICELDEQNRTVYKCAYCDKQIHSLFVAIYKSCPRCDKTFSDKVIVKRRKL